MSEKIYPPIGRIKKVIKQTYKEFEGYYKQHHIDVVREPDGTFYIMVRSPSGSYLYDGWWGNLDEDIDSAVEEALHGSCLLTHPGAAL